MLSSEFHPRSNHTTAGLVGHLRVDGEPPAKMMGMEETQVSLTLASHLTTPDLSFFILKGNTIIAAFPAS